MTMKTVELPSWDYVSEKLNQAELNPLEQFIYNEEPEGEEDDGCSNAAMWREDLKQAIEYCLNLEK